MVTAVQNENGGTFNLSLDGTDSVMLHVSCDSIHMDVSHVFTVCTCIFDHK